MDYLGDYYHYQRDYLAEIIITIREIIQEGLLESQVYSYGLMQEREKVFVQCLCAI